MYTPLLRSHAPWLAATALAAGFLAAGPIPQAAHYHAFADVRALGGLPNAADVLSNLGFLLVGLVGLMLPARREPAYAMLCAALVATALGSSWYHLAPDDARLVWDRLPIALACAAVLARTLGDGDGRGGRGGWGGWLAPLSLWAVGSVWWWRWSGDLRPYLLLQVLPLAVAPLLQWRRGAPARERRLFGLAVMLYVAAKLCEVADHALLDTLAVVSGHTFKHLLATAAACCLLAAWGKPAARTPAVLRAVDEQ
jgi:hypothetical protein